MDEYSSADGALVMKPRTSDPRLQTLRNSGRFGVLLTLFLHFPESYVIVASKNGEAAERAQVKRGRHGREEGSRPKRRLDAREPTWANRAKQKKKRLGGPCKSLIRLKTDKEIQAFP
jgi:hypothetical protein